MKKIYCFILAILLLLPCISNISTVYAEEGLEIVYNKTVAAFTETQTSLGDIYEIDYNMTTLKDFEFLLRSLYSPVREIEGYGLHILSQVYFSCASRVGFPGSIDYTSSYSLDLKILIGGTITKKNGSNYGDGIYCKFDLLPYSGIDIEYYLNALNSYFNSKNYAMCDILENELMNKVNQFCSTITNIKTEIKQGCINININNGTLVFNTDCSMFPNMSLMFDYSRFDLIQYLAIKQTTLLIKRLTLSYIINFETNCYIKIDAVEVSKNSFYNPQPLDLDGNEFVGWFTDIDLTKLFNAAEPITADITLYAGWKILMLDVNFYAKNEVIKIKFQYGTYYQNVIQSYTSVYGSNFEFYSDGNFNKKLNVQDRLLNGINIYVVDITEKPAEPRTEDPKTKDPGTEDPQPNDSDLFFKQFRDWVVDENGKYYLGGAGVLILFFGLYLILMKRRDA